MSIYQHGQESVKGASCHGVAPDTRLDSRVLDEGDGGETPTIIIEDESLRAGFTQLPNYVFRIRGLSHGAKLAYALLLSYAWQKDSCFPGQQTLADDLDVSVRSVGDYLRELQDRRLIRVQRRGLGKTNVYHILRFEPTRTRPPVTPPEDATTHAATATITGLQASRCDGR